MRSGRFSGLGRLASNDFEWFLPVIATVNYATKVSPKFWICLKAFQTRKKLDLVFRVHVDDLPIPGLNYFAIK